MTERMSGRRVAILVENLSVPSDRRVWQEALALTRAGPKVTVICPQGATRDRELFETREGVDIYRFPLSPASGGLRGYVREYGQALVSTRRLLRQLKGKQFDVVHACNPPDILLLAALSERRAGAAMIFDHHDLVPELFVSRFERKGLLHRATFRSESIAYRLAHVVLVTNESYRRVALTRGQKREEDVFVVRNAPSSSFLSPVEPEPALRRDKRFLIAYAGIMGPQDGVDHALRALAELARERRDWHAIFAGEGDELDAMRTLADRLGLAGSVEFTGWLDGEPLRRVLASAEVCLAPDPSNPLNDLSTMVKVVEYMALGRPIASYDLPETRFSAGDAAAYAVPNDPHSLAAVLSSLLDDPERRGRMGALGRARAEGRLSWEHSERSLLAAYERALSVAGRRTRQQGLRDR